MKKVLSENMRIIDDIQKCLQDLKRDNLLLLATLSDDNEPYDGDLEKLKGEIKRSQHLSKSTMMKSGIIRMMLDKLEMLS